MIAPCTCAPDGHARRCPHHTQEDFDAADRVREAATRITDEDLTRWLGIAVSDGPVAALIAEVRNLRAENMRLAEKIMGFESMRWPEEAHRLQQENNRLREEIAEAPARFRDQAMEAIEEHEKCHSLTVEGSLICPGCEAIRVVRDLPVRVEA